MAAMTTGLPDSSDYTIVDGNRIILKTDLEKDINKLWEYGWNVINTPK